MSKLTNASKNIPCPICGRPDHCSIVVENNIPAIAYCRKLGIMHTGHHKIGKDGVDFWIYQLQSGIRINHESNTNEEYISSKNKKRADSATLHKVYSALLTHLTLSELHQNNLRARGLSDEQIDFFEYKSIPLKKKDKRSIARILCKEFSQKICRSVPGIHVGEDQYRKGKLYADITCDPEIMVIPVRNLQGEIISLRIRKNDPKIIDGKAESRYSWFTGSGVNIHVPKKCRDLTFETIRLTEGEIKADIATELTGIPTLSIPGVKCWRILQPLLIALQPQKIILAYDADASINPDVAIPLQNLFKSLIYNEFSVELETWDISLGKGIDDLLVAGHKPTVITGDEVDPYIEEIVKLAKIAKPSKKEIDVKEAWERIGDIRKKGKEPGFFIDEQNIKDLATVWKSRTHCIEIKNALSAKVLKDVEKLIDEFYIEQEARNRAIKIDFRGNGNGCEGNGAAANSASLAAPAAPDSKIDTLNKKFAVVSAGSNVCILREEFNPENNKIETDFLRTGDFHLLHSNDFVSVRDENGNEKKITSSQYWLKHPERREHSRVVFMPCEPGSPEAEKLAEVKAYNLWRGFAVKPVPGDWSLFRQHIYDNICSHDEPLYQYVIAWMADAVQSPNDRPGTALVLRGKQGTGKGGFCREFGSLFGQHFVHASHPRYLTGNFNAHMKACLLFFCDEGYWAGDHAGEGALKALITEPSLLIEHKGRDPIKVTNRIRLMISSNSDWVCPAALEERRFVVIDVGKDQEQKDKYFKAITDQMENGGREAMLHDLLHYKSEVNLRKIPKTAALLEQKLLTLDPVGKFWYQRLQRGLLLDTDQAWEEQVPTINLHDLFIEESKNAGTARRAIEVEFGSKMKRFCPSKQNKYIYANVQIGKGETVYKRTPCYLFPSLDECRKEFELAIRAEIEWDNEEKQQPEETIKENGKDDLPF